MSKYSYFNNYYFKLFPKNHICIQTNQKLSYNLHDVLSVLYILLEYFLIFLIFNFINEHMINDIC